MGNLGQLDVCSIKNFSWLPNVNTYTYILIYTRIKKAGMQITTYHI